MTTEPTRPEIDFPGDEPPTELVIEDITIGDGPVAGAGHTVRAHYVGVAHSTGEEFDASWNRGDPLEFRLGVGMVIAGWDQGIEGMRVGGRRRLTIPRELSKRPTKTPRLSLWQVQLPAKEICRLVVPVRQQHICSSPNMNQRSIVNLQIGKWALALLAGGRGTCGYIGK